MNRENVEKSVTARYASARRSQRRAEGCLVSIFRLFIYAIIKKQSRSPCLAALSLLPSPPLASPPRREMCHQYSIELGSAALRSALGSAAPWATLPHAVTAKQLLPTGNPPGAYYRGRKRRNAKLAPHDDSDTITFNSLSRLSLRWWLFKMTYTLKFIFLMFMNIFNIWIFVKLVKLNVSNSWYSLLG